jgi:hypothetical protein
MELSPPGQDCYDKIAMQDRKRGWPERTVGTEQPARDRQNKTAVIGLPGQDHQDRAGSTGLLG